MKNLQRIKHGVHRVVDEAEDYSRMKEYSWNTETHIQAEFVNGSMN